MSRGVSDQERGALGVGPAPGRAHSRRTPMSARGEPQTWLTGVALVICVAAIAALLSVVVSGGLRAFWPAPIEQVTLAGGETFMGLPVREQAYDPDPVALKALREAVASGKAPPGSLTEDGRAVRRLYRVGNREARGQPFKWVDLAQIAKAERPSGAVMLERREWGVWIGLPRAVVVEREMPGAEAASAGGTAKTEWGEGPATRTDIGGGKVRERVVLAEGEAAALAKAMELKPGALALRSRIERIKERDIGRINARSERARLAYRGAELRRAEGGLDDAGLEKARRERDAAVASLEAEHRRLSEEVAALEERNAALRFVVDDPALKKFAPESQTRMDRPMLLSQVVRIVPANALDAAGHWGVYLDRWREFLTEEPREANTEGGVMPVIFGTVVMTLLLSLAVAPMGVIAALYLREYAKQGLIVSVVRIAVNNLAGVPSIVYGMFGLGFFCYTLGKYIDGGVSPEAAWPPRLWMMGVGALIVAVVLMAGARTLSRPIPGKPVRAVHHFFYWVALVLTLGVVGLLIALLATCPYFHGFFRERLPTATFGTKGILWAALTLALMTLPVVIVATEEAISAVPRSLREASFGCGASKWQTIYRVVLPRSAPGIMTGLILAMARGAGEVAPLMLVGAVKLAPELPVEASFPFIHLERSFMHLGFHIYDLAFQSPDSEAARPTVWATTLLLIVIVAFLNLSAIAIRARLRKKFSSGAF